MNKKFLLGVFVGLLPVGYAFKVCRESKQVTKQLAQTTDELNKRTDELIKLAEGDISETEKLLFNEEAYENVNKLIEMFEETKEE